MKGCPNMFETKEYYKVENERLEGENHRLMSVNEQQSKDICAMRGDLDLMTKGKSDAEDALRLETRNHKATQCAYNQKCKDYDELKKSISKMCLTTTVNVSGDYVINKEVKNKQEERKSA